MDYARYIGYCLLGIPLALAVFFLLGAKRRAQIPHFAWWLCLILAAVPCMYGLSHSTAPSFATRVTAVGKTYDYVERRIGGDRRGSYVYGFRFVPDGGEPVNIETQIILPNSDAPAIFDGRTFRVVYLQDSERALKNEAIDIAILSGKNAGFHDSFDADPVGAWLGMPIGAALALFGYLIFYYRKDGAKSAGSNKDAPSI